MFDSIGWAEILIIIVAGLFILGPERLPGAAAWLGRNVRKVREYATGARDQLRNEMGDDFDELRKPLEDLQQLRNFDPRRAVTRHLFDDVDSGNGHTKPNGHTPPPPSTPKRDTPPQPTAGEKSAPFDPDAT
ncbi:Sec-independent protein translocase protein TatB [Actinophytocola gossypii]|uniref:Sec-independent protein translocase protein TatB n=1 Tax=Actinophytocola gossypii TaxID=2812003 RepID=A0ABT2JHS7_9PSEU|nr:Sec-independent protein translocase protein TatB [Actinophytocola gossypii]MCT2587436.1 Sec-independent protein translocase subunit TatB [Actinophytocola gossypii]